MRFRIRRESVIRAISVASLIIVAIGAATTTTRWIWCEPMQEARLGCCCPRTGAEDLMRAPCCESIGTLAPAAAHATETPPRIAAAILAPVLAVVEIAPRASDVDARRARDYARAWPPGERIHAKIAVFLL